jgi:hypothetical protein
MKLNSLLGLYSVDNGWIIIYPSPNDETPVKEFYPSTEDGIVDLLYCIKENCLYHYNSKHNIYNVDIKKVKGKK